MASPPAASCRLLTLPRELRDHIYELAFTTEADAQDEIQLFDAVAPSKALVLACRQTHSETAALYKQAYCRYWTTGRFTVTSTSANRWGEDEVFLTGIQAMNHADLQHISNLLLWYWADGRLISKCTFDGVGWVCIDGGFLKFFRATRASEDSRLMKIFKFFRSSDEMHKAETDPLVASMKNQIRRMAGLLWAD